jgi:hypothetical protein
MNVAAEEEEEEYFSRLDFRFQTNFKKDCSSTINALAYSLQTT